MQTLPVELLHRVFDELDAETILLSVRSVSRSFRSVVNSYDRYVITFKLMSKRNFYMLYRLLSPDQVIAINFVNDQQTVGQISCFLSLVRLRQFNRLRSLAFVNVDEGRLKWILQRTNPTRLVAFDLNIRSYNSRHENSTTVILNSVLAQPTLRRLKLDIDAERMAMLSLSTPSALQHLTFHKDATSNDLFKISQCSPHIRTLVMKRLSLPITAAITSKPAPLISLQELTSLTVEEVEVPFDELESFLLLTPALTHLKLIQHEYTRTGYRLIDGERWDTFIGIHLSHLAKFEFYFDEWRSIEQTQIDLELTMASFRTPFWLEQKNWFVTGEFDSVLSFKIRLYSIPLCNSSIVYRLNSKVICSSTSPTMGSPSMARTENISSVFVDIAPDAYLPITEQNDFPAYRLCPQVVQIGNSSQFNWTEFFLQSFSMVIDTSRIVEIVLNSSYLTNSTEQFLDNINLVLSHAVGLSSLTILPYGWDFVGDQSGSIQSIIPPHLKHLSLPIGRIKEVERIIERCHQLLLAEFHATNLKLSAKITEWFDKNTVNSTCWEDDATVIVWLGERGPQSTEPDTQRKRPKLMTKV